MDGQAIIEIIGVLLVAFVVFVLVPLLLLFLFIRYRGGSEEMYQTAEALKSGTVTELLPWGSASLGELTREWVGASIYTANMFGRNDQGAGRVPSRGATSGWLLAFSMSAKNKGVEGKVLAMTTAHRLELSIEGGLCRVMLNGAALGRFRPGEPGLFGPDGVSLGTYRRELSGGQLVLRGRDVATIDTGTIGASERVESATPLVTNLLAARTPEDEAWTLVVAVHQLAWVGLGVG